MEEFSACLWQAEFLTPKAQQACVCVSSRVCLGVVIGSRGEASQRSHGCNPLPPHTPTGVVQPLPQGPAGRSVPCPARSAWGLSYWVFSQKHNSKLPSFLLASSLQLLPGPRTLSVWLSPMVWIPLPQLPHSPHRPPRDEVREHVFQECGRWGASLVWITIAVNICLAPRAGTGRQGRTRGLFPGSCKGMFSRVDL